MPVRRSSPRSSAASLSGAMARSAFLTTSLAGRYSTPAGSTAYNLSAHGPIIPLDAKILALTPISAFRPRRWRGALLPHTAQVTFEILEADKRPVSAVADNFEVRDVVAVQIAENRDVALRMLFDAGRSLEERVLAEQFSV